MLFGYCKVLQYLQSVLPLAAMPSQVQYSIVFCTAHYKTFELTCSMTFGIPLSDRKGCAVHSIELVAGRAIADAVAAAGHTARGGQSPLRALARADTGDAML